MGRATFAEEAAAPDTPSAGFVTLYFLASGSGIPVTKDDAGSVKTVVLAEAANVFTSNQRIDLGSTTAFIVEDEGTKDNVLHVNTTTARVGVNTSAAQKTLQVGPGTDAPTLGTDGIYVAMDGEASVVVRNNTDNVESFVRSSTASALWGTNSNHTLFIRTNNVSRLTILAGGDIGVNGVTAPSTALDIGAGAMEFEEMTAPGGGAANTARLYAVDSGGGKTQLAVVFNTGAVQVLATEP